MPRLVEVLPAIRSSSFDLPLTYDAGTHEIRLGDLVRIEVGTREEVGFVVGFPEHFSGRHLKPILERLDLPRAFDDEGLALARFVADHYLCTLGEALACVTAPGSVPRIVERIIRCESAPLPPRGSVGAQLLDVLRSEFPEGAPRERLLRHPAVRALGDRPALVRALADLEKRGAIERRRSYERPRQTPYRVETLVPGTVVPRGPVQRALVEFVTAHPGIRRADAVLAGFSTDAILRAIRSGALEIRVVEPIGEEQPGEPRLPELEPTDEQRRAIVLLQERLKERRFAPILLHGVTGSGKTLVYLHAAAGVVRDGGRAIILVPEISLTPQTSDRFARVFGSRVAVLHSALSERERYDVWMAAMRGDVDIVVGARSAVFAPLPDVRLIVVDEAHEFSYKQEQSPRYHAATVAYERMRRAGGTLVLASATPAMEHEAAARSGRIERIELRYRATEQPMPRVRIVDMRGEGGDGRSGIFSAVLIQALAERLERGEKSVFFLNRRGSAHFLLCRTCGSVPDCPRCSVSLTVHRRAGILRCHYCDYRERIPLHCRHCGSDAVKEFGFGTQRVEDEIRRLFPQARVVRMDADTTTRIGDHARLLTAFAREGDVLVGTQMVAKGLDFPDVTLVGVVAADIGLHVPDFRSSERVFALISQVCGRSGRATPGDAVVQTYAPDHPAIRHAAAHDYAGFADRELEERTILGYPPAKRLVYIGIVGRDHDRVAERARSYADLLRHARRCEVLGPVPYPVARVNEEWRYRIAVKTADLRALRAFIRRDVLPIARRERSVRMAINVDP